jgi:hypothetical protein
MSDSVREELASALRRLGARVLEDPDVRGVLRAAARLVLERTEPAAPSEAAQPPTTATTTATTMSGDVAAAVREAPASSPLSAPSRPEPYVAPQSHPQVTASSVAPAATTGAALYARQAAASSPPPRREPLIPLTLGQPRPASAQALLSTMAPARGHVGVGVGEDRPRESSELDDADTIASRCRLKSEAVRWAIERRKLLEAGDRKRADEGDDDILDRAGALPDCVLWMLDDQSAGVSAEPARAMLLSLGFEVAAVAADLLDALEDHPAALRDGLLLASEAQSALRVLVERLGGPKDRDQFHIYKHLLDLSSRHRIYINRFMRLDDPADPAALGRLRPRIEAILGQLDRTRGLARIRKRLIGRLKFHGGRVRHGQGTGDDRAKVLSAVDELIEGGLPPSAPELREHLLPILDEFEEASDLTKNVELAVREVAAYRDTRAALAARDEEEDGGLDEAPIPEVAEVARLLRGRSVVFIANVENPPARDALVRAFELDGIDWIVAREHQSIERFKPAIARPEVALVLLPIRWSSHSFGDIKPFCDELGKPLVHLPAGYHPNQVATQVLNQCSEQLRAGAPA